MATRDTKPMVQNMQGRPTTTIALAEHATRSSMTGRSTKGKVRGGARRESVETPRKQLGHPERGEVTLEDQGEL